jgi:multisubunit Na+/H+ antiporter MnhF subunit
VNLAPSIHLIELIAWHIDFHLTVVLPSMLGRVLVLDKLQVALPAFLSLVLRLDQIADFDAFLFDLLVGFLRVERTPIVVL